MAPWAGSTIRERNCYVMQTAAPFDLSAYPLDGDIRLISPPQRFDGGEEAYDERIGGAGRMDMLPSGQGAWKLAARYTTRPLETILEIGAGGGTCSIGLVAAAENAAILITDTSPRFLKMIGAKLRAADIAADKVSFATLAGEDLSRLPEGSCDAIVIASALHHVGDWRGFLRDAARVVRPGGTVVIQEPCREGNLMMGMAMDMALSPLWPKDARLSSGDVERIRRCRDSIYYLADSATEKVGEDKHSFLASELATAADQAGFTRTVFYANFHFSDLAGTDLENRQGRCSFWGYLESFLDAHHGVSADGIAKLRTHLSPILAGVDRAFIAGDGAPLLGCMVFCR